MTPAEVYAKLLTEQGLLVKIGAAGTLDFKYEGDKYVLLTYADDLQYIGISATYKVPPGVRRSLALREANGFTRRCKVVKVYVVPNRGVAISAQLLVKDPEQLDTVLLRLIRLVQSVASAYFARLAEGTAVAA